MICPSVSKAQEWDDILHEMLHVYLNLMSEWHGLKESHGTASTAIVGRLVLSGLKVHHLKLGS